MPIIFDYQDKSQPADQGKFEVSQDITVDNSTPLTFSHLILHHVVTVDSIMGQPLKGNHYKITIRRTLSDGGPAWIHVPSIRHTGCTEQSKSMEFDVPPVYYSRSRQRPPLAEPRVLPYCWKTGPFSGFTCTTDVAVDELVPGAVPTPIDSTAFQFSLNWVDHS